MIPGYCRACSCAIDDAPEASTASDDISMAVALFLPEDFVEFSNKRILSLKCALYST